MVVEVPRQFRPRRIETFFDEWAAAGLATVAVFPWVRVEDDIVEIVSRLAEADSGRWECRLSKAKLPRACTPIGIGYRTRSGFLSDTMGFAPLLTMPATRRAPVVALAAWAGGRDNGRAPPPEKRRPEALSFVDMAHGLADEKYDEVYSDTVKWANERFADPDDSPSKYYRITYCLSAGALVRLEARGVFAAHQSTRATETPS